MSVFLNSTASKEGERVNYTVENRYRKGLERRNRGIFSFFEPGVRKRRFFGVVVGEVLFKQG